ncbi:helix-turn-helix transcriptional regulator [Clostridium tertium]|uniref:helix-turn-helix transcriptional regulator n=1 Tax=Clostridium tertium TaxID=1559 RepID=UPI001FAB3B5C|nr:helix-turn-helix transcriptional regulator [Clostridium tertium]MDB1949186.1 helix-turn-helix transcriptional regulator [Clostridium tertium]
MEINKMRYKIKSLRVLNGIKAKDFAEKLGISREYLRLIENGKAKNPNKDLMIRIAKALDSDVQTLFFSEEE